MSKPIASFVIPAYNRGETIDRCIGSIANSSLVTKRGAYEIVIVDDASSDNTVERVEYWKKKFPYNITLLRFKDHLERVYARNAGMLQAQGEWIVWLDSDDEVSSHFKHAFEGLLDKHPTASVFNWAGVLHWRDKDGQYQRSSIRPTYQSEVGPLGNVVHFKSGGINTGAFAFKKSCLNTTGFLPQASDPYSFGRKAKGMFEDIAELYGSKEDLGNPFGDDYVMFYMLTRHWVPVPVDQILYIQHVRL